MGISGVVLNQGTLWVPILGSGLRAWDAISDSLPSQAALKKGPNLQKPLLLRNKVQEV